MRRAPARYRGNPGEPVALVQSSLREPAEAGASGLDRMAFPQVGSQPVFRMSSGSYRIHGSYRRIV